jgi:hypothetical protein
MLNYSAILNFQEKSFPIKILILPKILKNPILGDKYEHFRRHLE